MRKQEKSFLDRRRAGILLHPTSLPCPAFSESGVGDFGHNAYRFVDFLVNSGISVWQTLPLTPTHEDNSPYNSLSAHAGNTLLISLDLLVEQGWLEQGRSEQQESNPENNLNHFDCLRKARAGFDQHASDDDKSAFDSFVTQHSIWIHDYALYQALRGKFNTHWVDWPEIWRDKQQNIVDLDEKTQHQLADAIKQVLFEQYIFFSQWHALRRYANERDVLMFGDIPIFVAHDSADVWADKNQFLLGEDGYPTVVAGVPPDYFSATGQRWGNPLFDWEQMKKEGYAWWVNRLRTQLELFDLVRIDHFRGFEAYWEIAADCETALDGHWVSSPGDELFEKLQQTFKKLPVVAEDLGLITPEVTALRERYGFPGMKILQFAFSGDEENPYLLHNHERNNVVYTGTHDNDTTMGWFSSLPTDVQQHVLTYLDHPQDKMPWPLIRAAFNSIAELAIVPMQDILSLDSSHRMNVPGTLSEDNWHWQFSWDQLDENLPDKIRRIVEQSER